jgi:hypothetical protein
MDLLLRGGRHDLLAGINGDDLGLETELDRLFVIETFLLDEEMRRVARTKQVLFRERRPVVRGQFLRR